MEPKPKTSLYTKLEGITTRYLDVSANRFISKQLEHHLKKPAHLLTASDLLKQLDWIQVVASLLTDNDARIEQYIIELKKLALYNIKLGNT
ncbi:MAG: hypothetical protein NVS1B10_05460 [Candidatus Saccharimonadales bacterium]